MSFPRRFRIPFRRGRDLRRDIDAELAHHLDATTDELVRAGFPPAEAERVARDRLSHLERARPTLLRQDWLAELEHRLLVSVRALCQDLQFALRVARRRAATSALIIFTLAIGIGVAATFAGTVDALLIRPLAIDNPEQVMALQRVPTATGIPGKVAPGTVMDWRERSRSFEALAGAEPYSLSYDDGSGPRSIGTWRVTEGYFDVIRVVPAHGRALEVSDYADGADPVVVVSHGFWITRLGADPGAVGRTLPLERSRTPHRIVGVLPADFPFAEGREFYVPRVLTGAVRANRFANFYTAVARLAPGVSREAAETELRTIAAATAVEFPDSDRGFTAAVAPLAEWMVADVRPGLLLLLLAALLILLLASVNAASLLLAEATGRVRELAVRAALGAGRGRIVRQLVTESLLLAGVAGVLGLGVAASGLAALRRLAPDGMPRLAELGVDVRLVLLGGLLSMGVALLVSLPAAVRVGRSDLHSVLKPGGESPHPNLSPTRLRSALLAIQVALAVVLLAGGGLLLRSWLALSATRQGYVAGGVAGAEIHIWGAFPSAEARLAFARRIVGRVQEAPGVRASIATTLPLTSGIGNDDGEVRLPGTVGGLEVLGIVVHTGYFEVMGIERIAGQVMDERIQPDGERVVVINESLARRLWPAGDAVGARVEVAFGGPNTPHRVIGVVADVRYHSLEREAGPAIYLPYAQNPTGSIFVIAHSPASALDGAALIRQALRELAPAEPADQLVTLEEQTRLAGKTRRFSLALLAAFGVIAVLLTGTGLFGLMVHTVRSRTRELGIRLALGAWPDRLRHSVLVQAARLVAAGLAAGLVAFGLASGLLRGMVYGVAAFDPVTLLGVALLVGVVTLVAAWFPARMATQVDPASALRAD